MKMKMKMKTKMKMRSDWWTNQLHELEKK